ncbi:MAG: putative DNA modification/repair radical SAM protein [Coriobacteriaceae bacterium]|jgi:putative DNA modification/repair radical SAM protein|nr:putative DNA modification/repair radical SAM protein [Coriobacteriaceae bacterium]
MDIAEKLEILADAAKYDVACTSSGTQRDSQKGRLGSTTCAGICHSFAADGRCITLLKVLQTNVCVYDCAYCVNRRSNDIVRAAFSPQELADLTMGFYRRNFIEGLFLSSGIIKDPDFTVELMIRTVTLLRTEQGFRGYIHAKGVPGASTDLIAQLGTLVDRMSVNLELPSETSLGLLAPEKTKHDIFASMAYIKDHIAEDKDTRALMRKGTCYLSKASPARKTKAFVPAGQSTQMIVGASPEDDFHILNLSASLYEKLELKRVFFSAYLPVNNDWRLPSTDAIQLNREHRLYQADWLMRFYNFKVDEIITPEDPFLDPLLDPKANWAINNLDRFPIEVGTASYEELLRIPGIGVRGARSIIKARRTTALGEQELRRLGIAYKRARFFITCNGRYGGFGIDFTPEGIRAQLAAPIDGGHRGRRADKVPAGQMSLFESVDSQASQLFDHASYGGSTAVVPSSGSVPQSNASAALHLPAFSRHNGTPASGTACHRKRPVPASPVSKTARNTAAFPSSRMRKPREKAIVVAGKEA